MPVHIPCEPHQQVRSPRVCLSEALLASGVYRLGRRCRGTFGNRPLQCRGAEPQLLPRQTDRQTAFCQRSSSPALKDHLPTGKELDSFNASLTVTYWAPTVPRKAQECTTYTERNTDSLQPLVNYEHACRRSGTLFCCRFAAAVCSGSPLERRHSAEAHARPPALPFRSAPCASGGKEQPQNLQPPSQSISALLVSHLHPPASI